MRKKSKINLHLQQLQTNVDLINMENEARAEAFKHIIDPEKRAEYDRGIYERRFNREKN